MRIVLMKSDKLTNLILPNYVSGNYWITDIDKENKRRNLVNVEAVDGNWLLKSNFEVKVLAYGKEVDNVILKLNNFYVLRVNNEENVILYTDCILDRSYIKLETTNNFEYLIGRNNCDITFDYDAIKEQHLKLEYKNNIYTVTDLTNSGLTFINDVKENKKVLKFGDVIFLCGLKIIVMKDYILINQIGTKINYSDKLKRIEYSYQDIQIDEYDEENNIKPIYTKDDYFHKSPRFKTIIEKENMQIDAPPSKENVKEMPMIYTVGPMITMSMTSVVFALSAISNMTNNNKSIWTVLPTIIMAIAMLSSCALWPSLTRKYEKKQKIKREQERQDKYSNYIEGKRQKINLMMKMQSQILKDNYISPKECESIILEKKTNLWNREINDDDFLSLRVGLGNYPLEIDVRYHEEDFMMEDDNLKVMAESLVNETRNLENVPISYSIKDKYISGIVGEERLTYEFLNTLLLQITAFYSYDEVKLVFMTNENNQYKFEYLKFLPHIFSNDKSIRFFASSMNEKKEISLYLERIFQDRKISEIAKQENPYKNLKPYYIIITDDYDSIRDLEIIKDVLNQKNNIGFSLLMLSDKLSELPNECENFINIAEKSSGIFESEVASNNQQEFSADFPKDIDISSCFKYLSNIPIELLEEDSNLPKTLGFLEMYNVGMVEQLNIQGRYKRSNSITNLAVPVGVDKTGELLTLDLHEKAHGPHGLIAGMTGSGKSEFIITYILSMAVNYSPEEVAFVLIDYKGGGLAGAFLNKETGIKLPHLAGTITNLDIADMNRSLASIQSELRRRQEAFNKARDRYNESTIDIYKYQTLYKEGKVEEPIPHLIIISDEFAELKAQQPDFMDQLISTARIGRSLGVHLVLATQKPSGVVNDQIWSNSKFRVCLKVQESSDSMEMIKTKDAAAIKNVGRFYLQVGYNELFTLGQSAWCGTKYYPTEKIKKKVDTSVNFIDNIANVYKSSDNEVINLVDNGEELSSILNSVIEACDGKEVQKLWLDKIPEIIYVDELKEKYNYVETPYNINPIIGEYDDPNNQRQGLLTLNLSQLNNTAVYGIVGSGKELLLTTLLYSILKNHSVEEINTYILDCGTESLKVFNDAPHIGDILSINDPEKIDKMFQFLEKEMEIRKGIFSEHAGEYSVHVKNSNKKLPLMLFILNNYDNFIEAYNDWFDRLSQIVREGPRYGIVTIITAITPNSLRYRLRQNFKNEMTLQLSDPGEYFNLFGRFEKIVVSNCKGRGLVRLDNVFEYQVAYPYEESEMINSIRKLCQEISKNNPPAKKIPVLPRIVNCNFMKQKINDIKRVPIGVNKNSLEIEYFNFNTKSIPLITGQDVTNMQSFLNELLKSFVYINNISLLIFDAEDIITTIKSHKDNFEPIIDKFYNIIKENIGKQFTRKYICVIVGIDNLMGRISVESKNKLIELFNIDRDINDLNFVFVDSHSKLKKVEFEAWYKNNVSNNNGIWIGNGIVNQYTLMLNKITKEHRDEIADNFGYIINNGRTNLIKLLENVDDIEVLDE